MKLDEMELLDESKLDEIITMKRNKEMSQRSEMRKSDEIMWREKERRAQ